MDNWDRRVQEMIGIMDGCIKTEADEALTLRALSDRLGYSQAYVSRRFHRSAGMTLKDYLRLRRLAFALKDVRDTGDGVLTIGVRYGFSSGEAFARAFKEAYGVRLSADYAGPVPEQMQLMDVAEGDYQVFEHGPFDFETESAAVEAEIEAAMKKFDYKASGYELDLNQGRVFYFYYDPGRFFKYVRPVKRIQ